MQKVQQFTVFYAYAANYGFTCEAAEQGWGIEGSKGKRKRSREAQGTWKVPGWGRRMPKESVVGLGQSWVHPKAGQRRGITQ